MDELTKNVLTNDRIKESDPEAIGLYLDLKRFREEVETGQDALISIDEHLADLKEAGLHV